MPCSMHIQVANDWLNLRVPIWVTDLSFIPNTQQIVTSTNYHQVGCGFCSFLIFCIDLFVLKPVQNRKMTSLLLDHSIHLYTVMWMAVLHFDEQKCCNLKTLLSMLYFIYIFTLLLSRLLLSRIFKNTIKKSQLCEEIFQINQ